MKPLSDPSDVVDGNVALRSLNGTEVSPVHARPECQGLPTETTRGAQPAHVLRQGIAQGAFVRPLHERNGADWCFLGDLI